MGTVAHRHTRDGACDTRSGTGLKRAGPAVSRRRHDILNHRKLLRSKTMVVSVAETPYIVDARICKWTEEPSQHRPRTRPADPRENDAHQRHQGPVVQPGYRMRRLAESQWVYTRKICAYLALISSAERSTSTASSRISLISLKGLRSLRSLTSA